MRPRPDGAEPGALDLRFFKHEYLEHIRDKYCQAGVCSSLFDAPCQNACPADQNAWGYVSLIGEGRFKEAIAVIKESNPFPATCGRVCVHPCEGKCRRNQVDQAVAICALKRFAADTDMDSLDPYRPKVAASERQEGGGRRRRTCGAFGGLFPRPEDTG